MQLTTQIMEGALVYDLFQLALLIVLFLIVLLAIILLVPILLRLDLYKKGPLIEGKLLTSWLGLSARGSLKRSESGINGEIWIALLGIRLAKKDISARSPGEFYSIISGKKKDKTKAEVRTAGAKPVGAETDEAKIAGAETDEAKAVEAKAVEAKAVGDKAVEAEAAKSVPEEERLSQIERLQIEREKGDMEVLREVADRRDKEGAKERDEVRQGSGVESKEQKSKAKKKSRMPSPGSILAAAPALFHFLQDAMRSVDKKTICCRLGIGLDDPSDTAILSGRLWPIASALRYSGADMRIEPSFDEEKLDGELLADIRIRLLYLVTAAVSALRKKEIRSLLKEVMGWGQ